MTILHLTTFLQGGAGLVIASLAAAQRQAGHEVVVIASATGAPGYGNYDGHLDAVRRANVELHLVDSLFTRDLAANLDVVSFIEANFDARRIDVIHAHAAVPSLAALIVAGRATTRVPILQTMHGWGVAKTASQQRADVALMNLVDLVVVPAKTSATLLESLGVARERVQVIQYGVSAAPPRALPPHPVEAEMQRWRTDGGWVVCCSGTLGERKNQRLLVDAIATLPPGDSPLCVFVGDGDPGDLRARVEEAGVSDRVRLCGYRPDARAIAASADAFVLPSLSEGLPLAVLEAFADGVPVLASAIPEIAEAIEDGVTGLLFDPRSSNELAKALTRMRRLAPGDRDAMRAAAGARFEAKFTADRMHTDYLAAYDTLRQR